MFQFANPYYFLLMVPLGLALWFVYRRRIVNALLFSAGSRLPPQGFNWRLLLLPLLPLFFLAGLGLLIIALARPQTLFERVTSHTEAIAIMMVVDCSGSMEALDFSTRDITRNRLDAVKTTFAAFIEQRPNDLIGLVSFGGYATSRAPLTIDHPALLHVLKGVEVAKNIFDAQGQIMNQEETMTAIGDALATGAGRLEHVQNVKSRIMVLLSDGESNTGIIKPEQAVKIAKALGIKIYAIGVGSNGQAPVLVKDVFGRTRQVMMEVRLDEEVLRLIAAETGGEYFNVRDPHALENAMANINKLEKTKIDTTTFSQFKEWYAWFLLPGLALVLLGSGLSLWIRRTVI